MTLQQATPSTEEGLTAFNNWFLLCVGNDDFVENYNRLAGSRISFKPPHRTAFDKLIDAATGHVPLPKNNAAEMAGFLSFCADMFARLPAEPVAA